MPRFLLDMHKDPALIEAFACPRLQRFIGVIYRPETELVSDYMQSNLSRQYAGWVWLDRTTGLVGGVGSGTEADLADTWPTGL